MSSARYKLYLSDVIKLVRTMVIKNEQFADEINTLMDSLGYDRDLANPKTWKYYQNLAGLYHPSDLMMKVKSVDTLEEIEFTKANLQLHRATAREYSYGTSYYHSLVSTYPDQEQLILGILNPVDLDTAIKAENHTILFHDSSLVEERETELISRLQEWVKGYMNRWYIKGYTLTDELYSAAQFGQMIIAMVKQILSIRLANCGTNQVHSFHLWEYLDSNGGLGDYRDYLTSKQALWLYRNIKYLRCNAGKQETMDVMIQNLLTVRGFPISMYDIRHRLDKMPEEMYPEVDMVRTPINLVGTQTNQIVHRSLDYVLDKEIPLARYNGEILESAKKSITASVKNSRSDQLPTKVLESVVIDRSDSLPFTLADTLLNEWLHLSCTGNYKVMVTVEHPVSGETLTMTAKEAFMLYIWCFNKAADIELVNIPRTIAMRVRRLALPKFEQLRKEFPVERLSDSLIHYYIDKQVPIGNIISAEAFYERCVELHRVAILGFDLYSYREHEFERAIAEMMVSRFYQDVWCDFGVKGTYKQWFANKGFDFSKLSPADAEALALGLLNEATGKDLVTKVSLKSIHVAMLAIMQKLCSYTVQFIQTINSKPARVIGWAALRPGDSRAHSADYTWIEDSNVTLQELNTRYKLRIQLDMADLSGMSVKHHARSKAHYDTSLEFLGDGKAIVKYRMTQTDLRFGITRDDSEIDLDALLSKDILDGFYPPAWAPKP